MTGEYILNISTEPNENIYVNIKFLPKNILIVNEFEQNPKIKQIKLSFPNSGYNEIYYLRTNRLIEIIMLIVIFCVKYQEKLKHHMYI